jgi:peptidoglycan/xylan/chitin deacetylase (PgdA/CDA1 family)
VGSFLIKSWIALFSVMLSLVGQPATAMNAPKAQSPHLAILCYHHVNNNRGRPYNVTVEQFDQQLTVLERAGFHFVSLKQVEDFYYHGQALPDKSVAVTFDDANESVYTTAYPYLQKRGIPFALFIYPSIIPIGHKIGACTWAELKEMQAHGVTLGCHSYYHPLLASPGRGDRVFTPQGYAQWLKLQTAGAKQILEENLNTKINYFAIPFGAADTVVQQAVRNAGYTLCFNVTGGNNDMGTSPLNLNRTIVLTRHSANQVLQFCTPRALAIMTSPNNFERVYTDTVSINITVKNAQAFKNPWIFEATYIPARKVTPASDGTISIPVHLRKPGYYVASLDTQDAYGTPYKATWLFIYTKTKPFFLP